AVQVGAEDVAGGDALGRVFAIVAGALDHSTERPQLRSEVGLSAVVLESHQGGGLQAKLAGLDHDVADIPLPTWHGVQVDQRQARSSAPGAHFDRVPPPLRSLL